MAFILASSFNSNETDAEGNRFAVAMPDIFVTDIRRYVKKFDNLVYVCSDPDLHEVTDYRGGLVFDSLDLSGLKFVNKVIIDGRNKEKAVELIKSADLVLLAGGRVDLQIKFFKEIGLREILENYKGLVIGGSAGAMNLCEIVFCFPESSTDAKGFFFEGMGFYDKIVIPHFDGKNQRYTHESDIDVVSHILQHSHGREFIAYDDDSYIVVRGNDIRYVGSFYTIRDGRVQKFDG